MEDFELLVMTPYKVVFDGKAKRVVSKSEEGEFSVLADFENFITILAPTKMSITDESGKELEYFAAGGVLEVKDGKVIVCVDTVETKEEIDTKRAEESKKRAESRLDQIGGERLTQMKAKLALDRAIQRIEFAKAMKK